MSWRSSMLVFAWLCLVAVAELAHAEPSELRYDLRIDVPVTAVAATFLISSELAKSQLAAATCRWCDRAKDGTDTLNPVDAAFRTGLRWRNPNTADALSSVVGYALVPAASLGLLAAAAIHDDSLRRLPLDLLLVAESVTLATSLTQVVKFSVGRERPFVHQLAPADKAHTARPSDNNTSFYSGHTNLAVSLAVSAGTVASLRGYRWAPWVWVTGLSLATATAYLRVAGDQHYFTDVLAGAVTGAAFGFVVPFMFHRRTAKTLVIHATPLRGGSMCSLSWTM